MDSLRIGILAPLKRPLVAETTASRPHLVYEIAGRMAKRGHQVTVFGTGETIIEGVESVPVMEKSLAHMPPVENPFYLHTAALTRMIYEAKRREKDFDIFHNHQYPEFMGLILSSLTAVPMITTVHAQMTPELISALQLFPGAHLVSISRAHAGLAGGKLNMDIVYNGIDMEKYTMIENPSADYIFFLGRMTGAKDNAGNYLDPKGALTAIEVAKKTGIKLLMSGNVEDRAFYDRMIAPNLSDRIQFVGEVSTEQPLPREEVIRLMQNAKVFLMPIRWEEPFGLVMAEAMACGTPVVAFANGAAPELVESGKTGFVVGKDQVDDMVSAVKNIHLIDRKSCRAEVEAKFSIERMVDDYERLYYKYLGKVN